VPVLRIEHPVADFETWKQAFDADPAARRRSGVQRYEILREVGDPRFVMIDLELDTTAQAEALLTNLRPIWARVQGDLISNPRARIVESVETVEY
jgi:hypothetical protein